jgi:MFS transporter, FHS family, glucose/mannose:H+ symporter
LGLGIAIFGPAVPAFRQDFGISLSAAGALFTAHSAGYLAGVLFAGPLTDLRGRRPIATFGTALLAVGLALAATTASWSWYLASMIVAGLGFAFVDVALNAAIADAVADQRRRAAAMNLLHGAFPVGTLAAPMGLALAWQLGLGWRTAFLAIAALTVMALLGMLLWREDWPAPAAASGRRTKTSLLATLKEPQLVRLALVQGLYVGVELGIAGWIATYLVDTFGADEAIGALSTSIFWAGFLIGRPLLAYLTHRFGPMQSLPWMMGAGIAACGAGIFAPNAFVATAAYLLGAIAISGIFPTVMAVAQHGRAGDAGAVTALITAAASTGGLIWPWLVGAVADNIGLRVAMATAAVPLLAMLPLTLAAQQRDETETMTPDNVDAATPLHSGV